VTLFGNRIFANVIRLRWGYTGLQWAVIYDGGPYKMREIWTHKHMQRTICYKDRDIQKECLVEMG
jgi:hypothetical protein